MTRDLVIFKNGRSSRRLVIAFASWCIFQNFVFAIPGLPSGAKRVILRLFGCEVGKRVVLRRGFRVHFPWNLQIGDDCWIGEEVWFINHEKIKVGSNVCISQRSIISSSGHDYRSASLEYAHKPVEIKDGAWVCLDAKVLPGVIIGKCSVVSSGEIVRKSLPDYCLLIGGQVRPIVPPK
jgi:putative colanic acid biosynthesis acetyltransferase WcaF